MSTFFNCTNDRLVSLWCVASSVGLFFCGIFTILSFSPECWFVGLYIEAIVALIGALEATPFWSWSQIAMKVAEKGKSWQPKHRAILYYCLAPLCFYPCTGITSIFAGVLLIVDGCAYMTLVIGPKGQAGQPQGNAGYQDNDRAILMENRDQYEHTPDTSTMDPYLAEIEGRMASSSTQQQQYYPPAHPQQQPYR
eukprot:Colp12_sorted_trinity150504_noHs@19873